MKTLVCAFLYNRKELLTEERGKPMFWDKVAGVYDLFENLYNKKVYRETGIQVAKLININDKVLECACGTGAISIYIAKKAKRLVATDYSVGMLRQARKKLSSFSNVRLAKADITKQNMRTIPLIRWWREMLSIFCRNRKPHCRSLPMSASREAG